MFLKYRLKIRNWIKNNKNKIILVLIIWAIIFVINLILKNRKVEVTLNTTYTPHELVLSDTGETVPEKLREPIEKLIDDFVNYCNKKDYTVTNKILFGTRVHDNVNNKYVLVLSEGKIKGLKDDYLKVMDCNENKYIIKRDFLSPIED